MAKYELNEKEKQARSMICLPLDGVSKEKAETMVKGLAELVGLYKINDMFTAIGPDAIDTIVDNDGECFLDLKFHDIPNTVENYAYRAAQHEVYMFNVHAGGGLDMMKAAVKGVDRAEKEAKDSNLGFRRPKIYAVTILTSFDQARLLHTYQQLLEPELRTFNFEKFYSVSKIEKKKPEELTNEDKMMLDEWRNVLEDYGIQGVINEEVLHMAKMAKEAGLDGIVCSAKELAYVRPQMPADFSYTVPGIQSPSGKVGADQMRTDTPSGAVKNGASILVIGRAITGDAKENLTVEQMCENAYTVIKDIASVL